MIRTTDKFIKEIERISKYTKSKKIFLLTGQKSFKLSGAKKMLKGFLEKNKPKVFFKKLKIPEINELKKIIDEINKFKPDLILAIGGGAVLDYAKISSVFFNLDNVKKKILKADYKFKKKIPLLAVPTTAGSGAETTSSAVIYIDKIKYSVESKYLKPNYFLLVPNLIKDLNFRLKASSGFDAFAQSVESLFSKKSNKKSVYFAKKSLKILTKNYISFVTKPTIKNTYQMCLAANYSGEAINISRTTAPHALSYPFTAHFGIDHGHAVSLTLNDFLKFNYFNADMADCNFNLKERYKILFNITKTKNILELDQYIHDLKKKASLENSLKKLKININTSINKILSGVNPQRLGNNPVKINISDIKNILLSKI